MLHSLRLIATLFNSFTYEGRDAGILKYSTMVRFFFKFVVDVKFTSSLARDERKKTEKFLRKSTFNMYTVQKGVG